MIAIPATALAFATRWWKLALGIVLGAVLCFPLAQCRGERIGKQKMQLAIEQANTRFLTQKARADELASQQRITDTIAVNEQEEELRDAIADTPDTAPDAVRVQLGCARLRAADRGEADLPAVCRSGG